MTPAEPTRLRIVVLGLSITSSWGNGHATTYRALLRGLASRGHDVLFLERDTPWYAQHRDLPRPPFGRTELYADLEALRTHHLGAVRDADLVIIGSYLPDGIEVANWVLRVARGMRAFYDIDTPVTLDLLERGEELYLTRALVPRFDLYLSFSGGPTLERLERDFGAARALPLYCAVDAALYAPHPAVPRWDLGYLGTYAADRQPALERLLMTPARRSPAARFVVAGAQYPADLVWPANVERTDHVAPGDHAAWYGAQRFTLNVTRARMVEAGWSPSVRLFEAAACGTPIISDAWPGLDRLFAPGEEILIAERPEEVIAILRDLSEAHRVSIAYQARRRVLAEHTGERRAEQLERYLSEVPSAP
jgi:spore maturation protein CgeB